MRRAIRFVAVLIVGLGLLTLLGYAGLMRTTRRWYETDLTVQSRLAVEAARGALSRNWTSDRTRLRETLEDIAQDDRITAAAACSMAGEMLASTRYYPPQIQCAWVLERMPREGDAASPSSTTVNLPSGREHVSISRLEAKDGVLGAVVFVHDLGDLGWRETTARNLVLVAFFILSVGASLVTLLAARFARRGWTRELRRALTGAAPTEFQPLVSDVRALADRIAREREREKRAAAHGARNGFAPR